MAGDANPRPMKTHEGRLIDDLRQANILVVDHSKMNLAMIKKLLTRDGYDGVQTTQDPFSVASFCEEEAIDLVILAINESTGSNLRGHKSTGSADIWGQYTYF